MTFSVRAERSDGKSNSSHHFPSLLGRAGLSQGENVAADGDLPPDAGFRVLAEASAGVHHQHAVGGQPIHLTVKGPPLSCLLLQEQKTAESAIHQTLTSGYRFHQRVIVEAAAAAAEINRM